MIRVKFYETIADELLEFAVIVAKFQDKWVMCRHRERDTFECPGGHREPGETILETAKRELQEETGALTFSIEPLCVYSVTGKTRVVAEEKETFGMLYCGQISAFTPELHSEIAQVELFEELPDNWTYPQIQPLLLQEYERRKR